MRGNKERLISHSGEDVCARAALPFTPEWIPSLLLSLIKLRVNMWVKAVCLFIFVYCCWANAE